MKITFSPRAVADLHSISAYLRPRSPQGAKRVRSAILATLALLADFPLSGRRQTVEGVRKLATRKYAYLIYYKIDEIADEIVIIAIQHGSRAREFEDL